MSVKVKICGLTDLADAEAAAAAGADLLGFIFAAASPRRMTVAAVAEIARHLPAQVVKVGVFVDPPEDLVREALRECGLGLLQFHGEESPEFCTRFGRRSMKAFRVRDEHSLRALQDYATDLWLLDTYAEKQAGGTGQTFNWELALAARELGKPIFLAGGLTPANVADAVRRVRPFAVDVSSGVELSPGRKDHAKVAAFIRAAKGALRGSVEKRRNNGKSSSSSFSFSNVLVKKSWQIEDEDEEEQEQWILQRSPGEFRLALSPSPPRMAER